VTTGTSGDAGGFDTRVRRLSEKAVEDTQILVDIAASAVVAHVGVVLDGYPYVMPMACAPAYPADDADFALLLHGSSGSRLMRALADGTPACATITHVDAMVLARSAYESSMSYRSAMIMGQAVSLVGAAKESALAHLTDHLLPGRRAELRPTTPKESAATAIVRLPATQWSIKVSSGFADDPAADLESHADVWAGLLPVSTGWGPPLADPNSTHVSTPDYLRSWAPLGSPRPLGR
jgi:uncharacterized protein